MTDHDGTPKEQIIRAPSSSDGTSLDNDEYDDVDFDHVLPHRDSKFGKTPERPINSTQLERIENLLNTHQRNKVIVILLLTVALVILFGIEAAYSENPTHWRMVSLKVFKGVMAFCYGVIVVAFVPLFAAFIMLLKRHFDQIYKSIRVKLYISFVVFMAIMSLRFAMYCLI